VKRFEVNDNLITAKTQIAQRFRRERTGSKTQREG